ncbi:MAG: glycoside hydrolase family 10 protein [Planctomycetota bacterium]|jgi:hypothetical protein
MDLLSWDRASYAENETELKQAMERAASFGITRLLPHVKSFDFPLKKYCEAAREVGIKVSPWVKPTFSAQNLVKRTLSPENRERQLKQFGFELLRACMNNEQNREQGLSGINKLIEDHTGLIEGIHLDYVRNDNALLLKDYPCECETCKESRKKWLGHETLTREDLQNTAVMYKELTVRNGSVTSHVRNVKKLTADSELKLSMAARANYLNQPDIKEDPVYGLGPAVYEGQDWQAWAEEGLFDFICTMNYHTNPEIFTEMLNDHLRLLADTPAEFYTGIGIESSMGSLTPEKAEVLLNKAKETSAAGCNLFHFEAVTSEYKDVLNNFC